jgi:hypothetical protein
MCLPIQNQHRHNPHYLHTSNILNSQILSVHKPNPEISSLSRSPENLSPKISSTQESSIEIQYTAPKTTRLSHFFLRDVWSIEYRLTSRSADKEPYLTFDVDGHISRALDVVAESRSTMAISQICPVEPYGYGKEILLRDVGRQGFMEILD